jgi:hypothetical protein
MRNTSGLACSLLIASSVLVAAPSPVQAHRPAHISLAIVPIDGQHDALFAPPPSLLDGRVDHRSMLPPLTFAPLRSAGDEHLEKPRALDPIQLLAQQQGRSGGASTGMVLFKATSQLAAGVPRPLRFFFDGRVNIAAAIFGEGGAGIGVGGHLE